MGLYKMPGVYMVEKTPFSNTVEEVATSVPAFVGWTERADHRGRTLCLKPWRISSMAEFEQFFGGAPTAKHVRFTLVPADGTAPVADTARPLDARDAAPMPLGRTACTLRQTDGFYLLHAAMRLFFLNGGGACWVVSAGLHGEAVNAAGLIAAVDTLTKEQEPALLVVPDAVLLEQADCQRVQRAMLAHCSAKMKSRIAILDVWEGYRPRSDGADVVAAFRDGVGDHGLSYAAAYYPWLHTTVVQAGELTHRNLADAASLDVLIACLHDEIEQLGPTDATQRIALVNTLKTVTNEEGTKLQVASVLAISPLFKVLLNDMTRRLNLLPPAAALAGVCAMVDNTRGVWTAPANVGLAGVTAPAVSVSAEQQDDLNDTPSGKSVNAIRSVVGEGALVWGARTLDANSVDWRHVNVRRTMIMLDESIRLAAKALIFEPNTASTWTTVKSMITRYLTGVWQRGGLAGAMPEDAFSVQLGLGETMTAEDVLEGVMRVTVLVAIVRPAEFIGLTLQQQMQKH